VAPFKNDPILSGRSRRLFRHLKLQNPSINSNFREIWEKSEEEEESTSIEED